jgi:hypothetical protein
MISTHVKPTLIVLGLAMGCVGAENRQNKRPFLLNSKVPKDHRVVNHVRHRSGIGVF